MPVRVHCDHRLRPYGACGASINMTQKKDSLLSFCGHSRFADTPLRRRVTPRARSRQHLGAHAPNPRHLLEQGKVHPLGLQPTPHARALSCNAGRQSVAPAAPRGAPYTLTNPPPVSA